MSAKSIVVAAAALCLGTAAMAQDWTISNGAQVFTGYNTSEMIAVAQELGFQAQSQKLSDGATVITFTSANAIFYGGGTVCGATTCQGLALYAQYTPGFDIPLSKINDYNKSQMIVAVHKSGLGAVVGRYLIADFGEFRGNLASDLFNFEMRLRMFADFAAGGTASVSAKAESGAAGEQSAKSIEAAFAAEPADPAAFHREMAEFVSHSGPAVN